MRSCCAKPCRNREYKQVRAEHDGIHRQSILKEALAGRLVPQDSDNKPASELLTRTRTEREAAKPRKRRSKGGAPSCASWSFSRTTPESVLMHLRNTYKDVELGRIGNY